MQSEVIPFNFMTSPLWICPQPKICFSLGSHTKKSCLPQDLGTFLSHIPSHPESVHVYTELQTDQRQIVEWEQRFFLMNLQYLFHCIIRLQFLPLNCMP